MPSIASAKLGLGVSKYNEQVLVYVGETKSFPVGRVYNTGDEPFILTCIWKQKDGNYANCTLPLTVNPSFTLSPGESEQVFLNVTVPRDPPSKDYRGLYRGEVEVTAKGLVPVSGNPILPGGSLEVTIRIQESLDIPPNSTRNNDTDTDNDRVLHEWPFVLALVTVIVFVFGGCYAIYRHQKKTEELLDAQI